MKGKSPILVPVLLLSLCALLTGQETQEGTPWVELKSACFSFVLNPETGALLGIDPNQNTVTLYPPDYLDGKSKTVVGPVKMGTCPLRAVYKRYGGKSYFALVCWRDPHLFILDAGTLAVVKKIPLRGSLISKVATSLNVNDPYVYYLVGRSFKGRVARVSLESFADEGILLPGKASQVNVGKRCIPASELALSADGRILYVREYQIGPAYSPNKDEQTGVMRWDQLGPLDGRDRSPKHEWVPDRANQYVASGTEVYAREAIKKVKHLDFEAKVFLPNRPAVIGFSMVKKKDHRALVESGVVASSLDDFHVLGNADLPDGFRDVGELEIDKKHEASWSHIWFRYEMHLLADPRNDRAVVAYGPRVWTKSLKDLGVTDEPLLGFDAEIPDRVTVGQELTIAVKPVDPRCKIRLAKGPKGMVLRDNKLVWTPTAADMGAVSVVVATTHGEFEHTRTITLAVTRPYVALSFKPAGMALSPSGKLAVVWTAPIRDRSGRYGDERKTVEESRSLLALVDLKTRKVLSSRKLLHLVNVAAVDEHFVYVAPEGVSGVNALKLEDLSLVNRVETDSQVKVLQVASPTLLVAVRVDGVSTYTIPDLQPALTAFSSGPFVPRTGARAPLAPTMISQGVRDYYRKELAGNPSVVKLSDGWYIAGAVFGPDLKKPRMLANSKALPELSYRQARISARPTPWGRLDTREGLKTSAGKLIGKRRGGRTVVLTDYPLAATMITRSNDGQGNSVRLVLRELVVGEVVGDILLGEGIAVRYEGSFSDGSARGRIQTVGSDIVVLAGNRLYPYTIDDTTLNKLRPTFEFKRPTTVRTVAWNRFTQIKHSVRGGKRPFRFELSGTGRGMTVDPRTGTVTLAGPVLSDAGARRIVGHLENMVLAEVRAGNKAAVRSQQCASWFVRRKIQ